MRRAVVVALMLMGGLLVADARSQSPYRPTAKYWRTGHLSRSVEHNPAQTWWMVRYTERDATHYRRVVDYRALYDYPWSIPTPAALRRYAVPEESPPVKEIPVKEIPAEELPLF